MAREKQNPFKELEKSLHDVPADMKKKVMNDIATAKLVMDMASLFTCNYKSTLEGILKTNTKFNTNSN
ncbi:MAG: hypothetical protein ABJN95_00150 [Maribacter sp.]|uniref:hypothetical protein n=1 Tax=Maribacter sp. TaxID=1897614 RepID=UPI0032991CB8